MPSNDFDRGARYGLKEDSAGQLRWLLPNLPATLRFQRLLDSQSAPRPGEPDRRCDTIHELLDQTPGPPWAVIVEVFSESDADALDRSQEYQWRFRQELRHGPHGQDRYLMAQVLLFLTSAPAQVHSEMRLPGGDCLTLAVPRVVVLSRESALAVIEQIEQNQVALSVAIWLPLMAGGQSIAFATRCRELLQREPDTTRQRTLASLMVLFAELSDCRSIYEQQLEGLGVKESSFLQEIRNEGIREGRKEGIREGHKEGIKEGMIELIHSLERLRRQPQTPTARLMEQSLDELRTLARQLEQAMTEANGTH